MAGAVDSRTGKHGNGIVEKIRPFLVSEMRLEPVAGIEKTQASPAQIGDE